MSGDPDATTERTAALARDLDLIVGGFLALAAVGASRVADPALAVVGLTLLVTGVLAWLGEDRVEALWRAYSADPVARPRRLNVADERPIPRCRCRPLDGRPAGLAPARLVSDRHMTRNGR